MVLYAAKDIQMKMRKFFDMLSNNRYAFVMLNS